MSAESRARIMARVRGASRGQRAEAIERELAGFGVAPAAPLLHPDTGVAFMANVLANSGTLDIAADRATAVKRIAQYLYQHYRSQRLVAGNDPQLAALPWRDGGLLPRFGEWEPGEPVALSYARWGVAETGSTVLLSGKSNPSRNHLLPEHHLVLVELDKLLPDMESLWQQLKPQIDRGGRPRGINLISGPSSTADIQAQLVCGAHGPRAWHVIVMGNVSAEQLAAARELHRG